jgi:hypothetical protein
MVVKVDPSYYYSFAIQNHTEKKAARTAFVTGGGLGALLFLLAIVSVPQKKNPSTANSCCGSYMCMKKKGLEWI